MSVEEFFSLFIEEIKQNSSLSDYYRFLKNESLYEFRKAYYCQRLRYIEKNMPGSKDVTVFDIGCGYGTTAIFLKLNGYRVSGITIEYYYSQISKRLDYWKKFGPLDSLNLKYDNLFTSELCNNEYDIVIAQDVLHHLEPVGKAINLISRCTKPGGKIIVCEENGNNVLNRTRLFLKRGNRRIIEVYDENLKTNILLGNENIRSLHEWEKLSGAESLIVVKNSVEYIRYYFPYKYRKLETEKIISKEKSISQSNGFLREYFFHGLNYVLKRAT